MSSKQERYRIAVLDDYQDVDVAARRQMAAVGR